MRRKLTDQEKLFIETNYHKLTLIQIADIIGLQSPFNVRKYATSKNLSKGKKLLTEDQKQFIRNNYLQMKESEMAKQLGIPKFYVQEFKRNEGLVKNSWNRVKKEKSKTDSMIFDVDERLDWVA